ncbi:MAG: DUF4190 domain-containing protein [Acidimicrobiales bacterium]
MEQGSAAERTGASGWFPDPLGRYDHRWYNGTAWTADVSVDGQRYVDPLPLSAPGPAHQQPFSRQQQPPGWQGWQPGPVSPSRTTAVLSMVFGILAVVTGWMPIVFVVGAAAGVAGLVLGLVARRRIREGRASGAGLATAGLVLSPIGLALCAVGVMLTGSVLREVEAYVEPGPVHTEITDCAADPPGVSVTGTIENLDDEAHDYVVVIAVTERSGDLLERRSVEVADVAPGEVRDWTTLVLVSGAVPDTPSCELRDVTGPFPWGIDPNGN